MVEGEQDLSGERPYYPLPAGERVDSRSERGEGLPRRGKTPDVFLERARIARREPTDAEDKLWTYLRAGRLGDWKFRRQVPIGPFRADFVCPKAKLIIELDGSQHGDAVRYDDRRTAFLDREGYRVLRFWNNDVLAKTDHVLEAILAELTDPLPARLTPSRPSPLQGEGAK
jgi:very-short-patch-repair endonuclease